MLAVGAGPPSWAGRAWAGILLGGPDALTIGLVLWIAARVIGTDGIEREVTYHPDGRLFFVAAGGVRR